GEGEAAVAGAAVAGLMWGKQYYHFDVDRWLLGAPGTPTPPAGHRGGRDANWWHVHAADVISMPDPWEYPWFAAWDLAFHCVAIAHVDPAFAKSQLLLLLRDWYLHPDGQIPASDGPSGDFNPPVHPSATQPPCHIPAGPTRDCHASLHDRGRPRLGLGPERHAHAAAQIRLVGHAEEQRRQQPVRRRHRADGQHRHARPVRGPPRPRRPREDRRYRLDAHVRAEHA